MGDSFLGLALGIMTIGFMIAIPNLDILFVNFQQFTSESIQFIRLGLFALAMFFVLEVG